MQREVVLVSIVIAIMCLSTQAQLPGAGQCWVDVTDCMAESLNSTDPTMDPNSPSFSASDYLCCPLMEKTFNTDPSCFCSVSTYLHSPAAENVTAALITICQFFNSLDEFDSICSGANMESPTSPDLTPDTPDTTETPAVPESPGSTPNTPDTTETPAIPESSGLTPDTTETPALPPPKGLMPSTTTTPLGGAVSHRNGSGKYGLNKFVLTGSLSVIFILLTSFLY